MNIYLIDHETISTIVKGIILYGVNFELEDEPTELNSWVELISDSKEYGSKIGQYLVNENNKAYNKRWGIDLAPEQYDFEDIPVDERKIFDSINKYICEGIDSETYQNSKIHHCFERLKDSMLGNFIRRFGDKMPETGHEAI